MEGWLSSRDVRLYVCMVSAGGRLVGTVLLCGSYGDVILSCCIYGDVNLLCCSYGDVNLLCQCSYGDVT